MLLEQPGHKWVSAKGLPAARTVFSHPLVTASFACNVVVTCETQEECFQRAWCNIVIVVMVVYTFLAWAISDCNRFLMVKTRVKGWPPKFPNFYRQLGCSPGSPFQVFLFCFHCRRPGKSTRSRPFSLPRSGKEVCSACAKREAAWTCAFNRGRVHNSAAWQALRSKGTGLLRAAQET